MNTRQRLVSLFFALLLSACAASMTKTEGNAWLESKAGPSSERVAGKWTSSGNWTADWGEGNFIQDGWRFYGYMGSYYVDGALNGDHLYLALSSGKKLYYTAILRKAADGSYSGKATPGVLIDAPGAEDGGVVLINLRRIGN